MRRVILNGKRMISREIAHAYLKRKLDFPDYYGKNLDALWDLLTTIHEPLEIHVIHGDRMLAKMGDYGQRLLETLEEAAKESRHVTIVVHD
ncbi:MAG TPA: barstar family protein [Clostridiaceae bacterium]|nr:barstar family protein [Clostridiaceae bacterium]